jgi:quercetin dioxygenase-like cupin family protein
MVAQFIVSIGMHEHVERSVIEREPTYDVGKLRRRKRDLEAPSRMGSDLSLVKAAHLNPIAKLRGHHFAKFPGSIAAARIEIDMRMPARDTGHVEIRHYERRLNHRGTIDFSANQILLLRRMNLVKESDMRSTTIGGFLVCAAALATPAAGQTQPTAPAPARTVVASTKLPTVGDTPVHFKAVRVTIPSGASSSVSSTNGILYQLSGSTEVSIGGEVKTLSPGEGLFIGSGNTPMLKAGDGGPSNFLHFLLTPTADLDKPLEAPPAMVQELYRTVAPLPALKPGRYDLNLTRVTFPAQMPSNSPHHRSGAALYYIISGTGANTVEDKLEAKTPGSLIYEPFGLVHQWGNPGAEPLTFLAFNINPEGVAAVLPGAPAKSQ